MYLDFYNLKKEPFNITPDPELLFLSPSHKEALAAAIYGVTQRKGFVAIIGEVGVGKTTVVRSFLEKLKGPELKVIYLFNADISFKSLIKLVYQNLGYACESEDVFEAVNRLHYILIDLYRSGINVALVIDEAQNLPAETLKNLHMLSNLETSTSKLIQVVFSGQPEFEAKLEQDLLRQIKQRIVIRVRILPLSKKESLAYVNHRLRKTAKRDPDLFTKGALREIVNHADGIPRVINTLCDNSLITSFARRQPKVTAKVAREAVRDVTGKTLPHSGWKPLYFGGCLLAGTAGLWLVAGGHLEREEKVPAQLGAPERVASLPPAPPVGGTPVRADPPSVEVGGPAPPPPEGMAVQRVKRGDTLAKLLLERYGFVDKELITSVMKTNPAILDEDVIQEGQSIYFPPPSGAGPVVPPPAATDKGKER